MARAAHRTWVAAALLGTAALAAPALADVRGGVDAWGRGDYAAAVAAWEGPAATGDADAMFNLAQAYRLGRGVPQDEARAEALYFRAAQAGHVQAADTYGLMLFQAGRRAEALPYVEDAARRGDPRSQYLLGIAHFNGDMVERDWVRAYALLTLANSAGLPQAGPAIAQMDEHIALTDRRRAAELAEAMRAEALAARSAELAAADLALRASGDSSASASPVAASSPRVPRPIASVAVSPSVAAARSAIAEARSATGTDSPAQAGATFAQAEPAARPAAPAAPPAPVRAAPAAAAAASQAATGGPWRVQLGAFSVRANAERLWSQLSGRPELAGAERMMVASGNVTRLLAAGYASQAAAQNACNALKRGGTDCLVTRN
ncbi:SPOR domain-containing protein [Alteraurantiacibacter palmitatis]|uniref:SPOR domain-containing protein n=1 Tax=Alteraurantiacibacter palmitatis TaxID=2054628 RepID=A0ABV7E9H5_9SPHN